MSRTMWVGVVMVLAGVLLGSLGGGIGGDWYRWGYWVNLFLSICGFVLIVMGRRKRE